MDNDMLEAYLFEMNTLLEQIDELVLGSEKAGTFTDEDVNEIFRIMHTIKGSSAMMEYNSLMTVAHRVEDLFFIVREKSMEVIPQELRPELFDLIFQAIDFFRSELEKIEQNEPLAEENGALVQKVEGFTAKIQARINGEAEPAEAAPAVEAATDAAALAEAAVNSEDLAERFASAERPCALQIFFDEGCGMANLRAFMVVNALRDALEGVDFDFLPSDVESNPETAGFIVENGFFLRFVNEESRSVAVPIATGVGSVSSYQLFDYEPLAQPAAPTAAPQPEPVPAAAPAAAPAPAAAQPPAAQGGGKPQQSNKESLISVNLSKLDKLMAVVSEIVIAELMVTASPDLKGLKLDNFTQASRQLRSLTDELQDVSMSLRMVPVSATFQKMKRIVRDMSKKLNRETVLELVGEDTEVDKTIVDSIGDPIMHIVRNSMDHGIEEQASERIAAGKDPVGKIILSARHTGSEVIIEVIDDGRGANDEAILNKAMRQGLAQPGIDYSHKDILNFLLMPGFSTNTEVTEYSGRGVGMDVVRSNVENVGGTVTLASELGQGMTTTLKIPLTMAIMDGMEVSVGESIFTIPINNIRQIFKFSEQDIVHDAVRGETLKVMDNFYSVIRAKDFYQLEQGVDQIDEGIVLWVEAGDISYCLFVDDLIGEQQVVVKPLPAFINDYGIKNSGVSGCTILGDGTISIILDVANIYLSSMGFER